MTAPSLDPPPFFIVGAPRSGTTMLRLMLDAHPSISVPPESHFLIDLPRRLGPDPSWETMVEGLRSDERFNEWGLDPDRVSEVLGELRGPTERTWRGLFVAVFEAWARSRGAARWGDKTPIYAMHLTELFRLFPEAVVVHIVRDGRDVACSLRSMPWFDGDLHDAGRRWARTIAAARGSGPMHFGLRYHEIRYEALVEDPRAVLGSLMEAIGETLDERQLAFHERADEAIPEHRRAWHEQTSRPVNESAVGRWRTELDAAEVRVVEVACSPWLARLGYEPTMGSIEAGGRRLVSDARRHLARWIRGRR